ncbi:helix-turn-helix domain-containing protein [Streptomyces sp. NPDC047082]|uniref:helix-turn-helix domain-containing protein n=1 Tax=Streptomyces sp. NPDC047082 TaxID=3155259 RepID=UPI0033C2D672
MDSHMHTPHAREDRDRTFAVLNALLQLGPGPHKFRTIVRRSGLPNDTVHRRLRQLIAAQLCRRPRRGYYELQSAAAPISGTPGLVHPSSVPLLDVDHLLEALHRRTQQVILLHTYSPVTSERLCIAAAGTNNERLQREMALVPAAIDHLRQAPLDSDAPGLAILAHLVGHDTPPREDLRRIRATQVAHSRSPLPGWAIVSVPVRRLPGAPSIPGAEPRVVAAVSVLAPERFPRAHLVAYGRMMQEVVRAASETTVIITRADLATAQAA